MPAFVHFNFSSVHPGLFNKFEILWGREQRIIHIGTAHCLAHCRSSVHVCTNAHGERSGTASWSGRSTVQHWLWHHHGSSLMKLLGFGWTLHLQSWSHQVSLPQTSQAVVAHESSQQGKMHLHIKCTPSSPPYDTCEHIFKQTKRFFTFLSLFFVFRINDRVFFLTAAAYT